MQPLWTKGDTTNSDGQHENRDDDRNSVQTQPTSAQRQELTDTLGRLERAASVSDVVEHQCRSLPETRQYVVYVAVGYPNQPCNSERNRV